MDSDSEIREFPVIRRVRVSPEQAELPRGAGSPAQDRLVVLARAELTGRTTP